jgi:uncharacterized protein (TIGR00730 family)
MNDSTPELARLLESPSYRVAYNDVDLLNQPELRAARMELEFIKPDLYFQRNNIRSTVVVFGSTRIVEPSVAQAQLDEAKRELAAAPADPQRRREVGRAEQLLARSRYYDAAREFARQVSVMGQHAEQGEYVITTGGGPGIMEAANRGAHDVAAKSIGLNIHLPHEQQPNVYITPELCFQFHYFAIRKFHFLLRAKALVVFPGGFGTLDELFDALALRQTGRMQAIPVILFGREYWERVIDFQFLADAGMITDGDLDLLDFVETAEEACAIIRRGARGEGSGLRG